MSRKSSLTPLRSAKNATEAFICSTEKAASDSQTAFNDQGGKGLSNEALDKGGEALHTVTDATSPAHTDQQGNPAPWDLHGGNARALGNMARHAWKERNISPEQMKEAVNAARQEFGKIFGDKALNQAITAPKPKTNEASRKREDDD